MSNNMEITKESLQQTLKRNWGYSRFRPQQLESCQKILMGKDVVALMATGSGKSLIYQLPSVALRENGIRATTLVISPLIALIEDQVTSLRALGISVGGIGGNFDYGSEVNAQNGEFAVVYSTPEKILCWQHGLDQLMKNSKLVCIAIDESHCVSEWGHDFRPHYRRLGELRGWFQSLRIPIVALTATATPLILNDIINNLKLVEPYIAKTTLNRKNIKYMIRTRSGSSDLLFLFIELRKNQLSSSQSMFPPTLVYVNTKKEAEDLTMRTRESQHQHLRGLAISFYHAGMTLTNRSQVQADFMENKLNIVVATVAFGLGINKPDIRVVINYGMSKAIESYYQQTGRAGRDGDPSYAYLLYNRQDSVKLFGIVTHGDGTVDSRVQAQIAGMSDYCKLVGCRRKYLLNYLCEEISDNNTDLEYSKSSCCDWCDENYGNTKENIVEDDGGWIGSDTNNRSNQILNFGQEITLLLRTIVDLGEFYGISIPIAFLCGSHEKSIRDKINNYTKMRTFGKGSNHTREYWKALANQLTDVESLLETVFTKSNTFAFERYKVTDKGRAYLNKSRNVIADETAIYEEYLMEPKGKFLELHIMDANKGVKVPGQRDFSMYERDYSNITTERPIVISAEDKAIAEHQAKRKSLEDEIRRVRGEVAKKKGTNAYNVLSSNDIANIANSCPCTVDELKQVEGWTDWKVSLYGEDFISAITAFVETYNYQRESPMIRSSSSSSSSSSAPMIESKLLTLRKENVDNNTFTSVKVVSTANIYKPLYMSEAYINTSTTNTTNTNTTNTTNANTTNTTNANTTNANTTNADTPSMTKSSAIVANTATIKSSPCNGNRYNDNIGDDDDDNFESFVPSFSIRSNVEDDRNAWIDGFVYDGINNDNNNNTQKNNIMDNNNNNNNNDNSNIIETQKHNKTNDNNNTSITYQTKGNSRRKDEELLFDEPVDMVITKATDVTTSNVSLSKEVNSDEIGRIKKKRKSLFDNMNYQSSDLYDDNKNYDDNNSSNDNIDINGMSKFPKTTDDNIDINDINFNDME